MKSILSNWTDSMNLATEAVNANGNALDNQEKYEESLEGRIQGLSTELDKLFLNILDGDKSNGIVDLLKNVLELVNSLVDKFGVLGTIALGGGLFAGLKDAGIFSANGLINGIKKSDNSGFKKAIDGLIGGFNISSKEITGGVLSGVSFNKDDLSVIGKLNEEYKNGLPDMAKYHDLMDKLSIDQQNVVKSSEDAQKGMEQIHIGMDSYTKASKLATIGTKALSTALNVVGNMAIMWGISKAIEGLSYLANMEEETAKRADEMSDKLKEFNDSIGKGKKDISELSSRYEELSKGVNQFGERISLTDDEYTEYKDIISKVSDLMPDLTARYNENGEKIGFIRDNLKSLNEEYDEYEKRKARDFLINGDSEGNTIQDILDAYEDSTDDDGNDWTEFWHGAVNELGRLVTFGGQKGIAEDWFGTESLYDSKTKLDELKKLVGKSKDEWQSILEDTDFDDSPMANLVEDALDIDVDKVAKMNDADFQALQDKLSAKINSFKDELNNKASGVGKALQTMIVSLENDTVSGVEDIENSEADTTIQNLFANFNSDLLADLKKSGVDTSNELELRTYINSLAKTINANEDVQTAFSELFKIDFSKMSIADAKKQIEEYIHSISETFAPGLNEKDRKENEKHLRQTFGLDIDSNPNLGKAKSFFGNDIKDRAEELTPDEVAIAAKFDVPEGSIKTWDELIKRIKEAKKESEGAAENAKKSAKKLSFKEAWKELDENFTDDSYEGKFTRFGFVKDDYTDLSKFKEKVIELGEAGKLTSKNLENLDGCNEFLEATGLSATEAAKKMNELVDSSKQLSGMSTGIKAITSAYDEKKENRKKSNVVSSSTLNSLGDTLGVSEWEGKDKKVWEEYKKVAGDSSKGLKELKSAQDDLATSFVNNRNFLSNLNEENKDYYISLLKEMGVENANEIVTKKLATSKLGLKIAAKELGIEEEELTEKTGDEIIELFNNADASDTAKTALFNLYIEKVKLGEVKINTVSDCNQLYNMAKQAGSTAGTLQKILDLKSKIGMKKTVSDIENGGNGLKTKKANDGYGGKTTLYQWSKKNGGDGKYYSKAEYLEKIQNNKSSSNETAEDIQDDLSNAKVKKVSTTSGDKSNGSKDKGSNSSGSSKDKTEIDWLERRLTRMQQIVDLTNTKLQNLFSVKDKNNNLGKQIKQNTTLMKQYSRAADIYEKKFKTASKSTTKGTGKKKKTIKGLSKDIIDKIKSGEYTKESYSKLVKRYGSDYADKINRYIGYWDKREDALKNVEEQKAKIRQNKIDQQNNIKDEAENNINLLNAKKENDLIVNKLGYYDKIKTQTEKSYDAQIKIAEIEKNVTEQKRLQQEKEKAILQLKQDQVDAIKEQYDYNRGMLESGKYDSNGNLKKRGFNYYNNQIDILESRGLMLDSSWYESKNALERQNIADKQDEREKLAAQLPNFKEGTQAWQKLQSDISDCDNSIAESIKSINANSASIRELKDKIDEKFYNNISNLHNEFDFLSSLKYGETTDSDTGNFTDTGNLKMIAEYFKMTSSITGREKAEKDYNSFNEALENYKNGKATNDDLERLKGYFNDDGSLNLQEAENKLEDYRSKVQEQINNEISGEQAIIDLMKQKYEAQKSYLQDIINAKKEALDIEKDLYDYERNIADKTKNVANLQKQINAVRGDDSEEGMARLSKLQVSLDEANRDLQDTEYERYLSDQKNMLDELFSEYEDLVKNLEKDTQAILKDGLDYIKNKEGLGKLLNDAADDYGYVKSETLDDVVNAFEDGKPININNPQDQPLSELIQTKCNEIVSAIKEEQGSDNSYDNNGNSNIGNTVSGTANYTSKAIDNTKTSTVKMKDLHGLNTAGSKANDRYGVNQFIRNNGKKPKKNHKYSDLNNAIKKEFEVVLSDGNLKKLAKQVGVTYDNATKNGSLYKKLKSMKVQGFKTGGIGRLVKANGEDGLAMVRNGEGFVAPEHVEAIKGLLDITPDLNELVGDMIKIPSNLVKPSQNNIGDVSFEFNLPDVKDPQSFLTTIQNDKKVQKALQEVTLGRVNGNGKLSVNRIR